MRVEPRWLFGAAVVALLLGGVSIAAGWLVFGPMCFLAFELCVILGLVFQTTPGEIQHPAPILPTETES